MHAHDAPTPHHPNYCRGTFRPISYTASFPFGSGKRGAERTIRPSPTLHRPHRAALLGHLCPRPARPRPRLLLRR